jgi:hypothetical protein
MDLSLDTVVQVLGKLLVTIPWWGGLVYFSWSFASGRLLRDRQRLTLLAYNATLYPFLYAGLFGLCVGFGDFIGKVEVRDVAMRDAVLEEAMRGKEEANAAAAAVFAGLPVLILLFIVDGFVASIAACAYAITTTALIIWHFSGRRPWMPFVAGLFAVVAVLMMLKLTGMDTAEYKFTPDNRPAVPDEPPVSDIGSL